MTECESFTCHNEATKQWKGRGVCDKHYKVPLDECMDPNCHREAVRQLNDMILCSMHYKQYQEEVDDVRRDSYFH